MCIRDSDGATGAPRSWTAPGTWTLLAASGSTLYVSGTTMGGQARNLATLDAATGLVTTWNPNPNGAVSGVVVSGSTVYARGAFSNIGGQARAGLAADVAER